MALWLPCLCRVVLPRAKKSRVKDRAQVLGVCCAAVECQSLEVYQVH